MSRLTLELEQLKEKSTSENARLNTRLHDLEEEFTQEKRLLVAQKLKIENDTAEAKESLINKIRELTNELDHLQSNASTKGDTQLRLMEVEKLTLTRYALMSAPLLYSLFLIQF